MLTSPKVIYENWDTSKPIEYDVNSLYNLMPIGIGTPYIESLTSYVSRLSHTHNIPLTKFLRFEIGKYSTSAYFNNPNYLGALNRNLNNVSITTLELIKSLELATGRNDLIYLTLSPWTGILHTRLLRFNRAWCPLCLDEWKLKSEVIYEPLIWYLKEYTKCLIHGVKIEERCTTCNSVLQFISSTPKMGYCYKCSSWLGRSVENKILMEGQSNQTQADRWERWILESYCKMIEIAPEMLLCPIKYFLPSYFKKIMKIFSIKYQRDFADYFNINRTTASQWFLNTKNTPIHVFLAISFVIKTDMFTLLLKDEDISNYQIDIEALDFVRTNVLNKRSNIPSNKLLMKIRLERALIDNPPKSFRYICKKYNYCESSPRTFFPKLSKQISKRYISFIRKNKNERIARICNEAATIINKLHQNGIYPSRANLQKRMSKPYYVLHDEVRQLHKKMVTELGYISKSRRNKH